MTTLKKLKEFFNHHIHKSNKRETQTLASQNNFQNNMQGIPLVPSADPLQSHDIQNQTIPSVPSVDPTNSQSPINQTQTIPFAPSLIDPTKSQTPTYPMQNPPVVPSVATHQDSFYQVYSSPKVYKNPQQSSLDDCLDDCSKNSFLDCDSPNDPCYCDPHVRLF